MDIINMINSADRYFHPEEFIDECAEKLGSRIISCHIKDVHLNEAYTLRLEECPPGQGEFPLRYYAEKMNAIDPEMPMIVEHLSTDDEYPKYVEYLKKSWRGLYEGTIPPKIYKLGGEYGKNVKNSYCDNHVGCDRCVDDRLRHGR
ncbi:MAG: hypothetical protein K6F44_04405 [Lachnospiraceae bacterium]|nr:hypothetical protein [Lachnospiraceae bacterium]